MIKTARDIAEKYGMMSVGEVTLLQHIAKQLPPNPIVVNIGAGAGTSACSILEVRPDAFIWSFDINPAPLEFESLKDCNLFLLHRCVRILVNTMLPVDYPIVPDLVFVDGDHTNKAVRNDTVNWFPKLRMGGFIFFHDYNHPNLPDLSGIVDRLMSKQERIGQDRYLVAFKKITDGEE